VLSKEKGISNKPFNGA